jgi:hypothetical protein
MATDFLAFTEGENFVLAGGLPSTCYFLLSTKNCATFTIGDTLAGGVAEITGTGYARMSQAVPTPSSGQAAFTIMTWNTGAATNWPNSVRSLVLATTTDNSGKAICAWNLIPGGGARDMSAASTTESVTPTLTTSS